MLKIILTIDLKTHRALYDNEATVLGLFRSMAEAEKELGDVIRFCSIQAAYEGLRD